MSILTSLGVNDTVWLMFGLFAVSYFVISRLVFLPYMKAHSQRLSKTTGNQEVASKYLAEADVLQAEFAAQAKELNSQYRSLFDKKRTEAMEQYDRMVSEARAESEKILEQSRKNLSEEMAKAKGQVPQLLPEIETEIIKKVLGKEVAL